MRHHHGRIDPASPARVRAPALTSLSLGSYEDLLACEERADLSIAVGTSLCGMNADRVVSTPAAKAPAKALGSVVIGLQRTVTAGALPPPHLARLIRARTRQVLDDSCTLRIFAPCDSVFAALADELALGDTVPSPRGVGTFFQPPALEAAAAAARAEGGLAEGGGSAGAEGEEAPAGYLLRSLRFDAMGRAWAEGGAEMTPLTLDLRDGAAVLIPTGVHAGARGKVDGCDREGHPRIRFHLRVKTFKAPMSLTLGTWWLQAAADGDVAQLPVVNQPAGATDDTSEAAARLRQLAEAY